MNRRAFIVSSSIVAAAVPVAYYFKKNKFKKYNPVYTPDFLSTICDEASIKNMGKAFLKQRPAENSKKILKAAVLADEKGNEVSKSDDAATTEFINSKISAEFKSGNLLLASGWIITETEARQCALFSLYY
jgi:hypothetical protein